MDKKSVSILIVLILLLQSCFIGDHTITFWWPNHFRYRFESKFKIPGTEYYGILADTSNVRYSSIYLCKDSTVLVNNRHDSMVTVIRLSNRGDYGDHFLYISKDSILFNGHWRDYMIQSGNVGCEFTSKMSIHSGRAIDFYPRYPYTTLWINTRDDSFRYLQSLEDDPNAHWEFIETSSEMVTCGEHRMQRKERLKGFFMNRLGITK